MQDESLPSKGPGTPDNGNFVVTEFEVLAASADKPKQFKPVKLTGAKADFLQSGFNVNLAVDGKKGNQNAWAVHGATGVTHWATFETAAPVNHDKGTVLKFVIHQNHSAKEHLLGRFRISVTQTKKPGLSLPESLKAIVRTPAANRNEVQQASLLEWFGKIDKTLVTKTNALNDARKPLPEDPQVARLKAQLALVSAAVREDGSLVRLRSDMEYSQKQLAAKRLTAAQDLAWALINSPAFLFNH